jgi:hypothetical protein
VCLPAVAYALLPAGDIDGVAYLQKYTTLEHIHADQVDKLTSDIIYRRLVEVRHTHTVLTTPDIQFSKA